MKILYVEDNPEAITPVQRIAAHFGYDLLTADTIAGGLALLHEAPDLVIADMLLPDGDAIAFTQQARQQSTTLPIVIFSGYTVSGEPEACFKAGCTEYYIKPVEVQTLMTLFNRYTADKQG